MPFRRRAPILPLMPLLLPTAALHVRRRPVLRGCAAPPAAAAPVIPDSTLLKIFLHCRSRDKGEIWKGEAADESVRLTPDRFVWTLTSRTVLLCKMNVEND